MTGDQRARLRAVWEKIPDVGCKGLCADYCGPIGASRLEVRMLERRGVRLPDVRVVVERWVNVLDGGDPEGRPDDEVQLACPALVDGRCSVYDIRPTVCRLWGATDPMPCPHGCEPNGGRLSVDDGFDLLAESLKIGGR